MSPLHPQSTGEEVDTDTAPLAEKMLIAVSCMLIAVIVILACAYVNRPKTYEGGAKGTLTVGTHAPAYVTLCNLDFAGSGGIAMQKVAMPL